MKKEKKDFSWCWCSREKSRAGFSVFDFQSYTTHHAKLLSFDPVY
jgi:hypothetical protein